ncbi:MAG: LPS-assembly lipoprotein [Oceanospirillaceae bacterium]|jgi:LPS-assembly lipoprotein
MFAMKRSVIASHLKIFITSCMLLLLIGCGFSLRGNIDIPLEARSIWLVLDNKQNSPLLRQFKALAETNDLLLDENADNRIIISRSSFRRITTSRNSNAGVDEYTLRGELTFNIIGQDEQLIATNLNAFAERTFQYDANDGAASNSREAFLSKELRTELAQQILRQYSAHFKTK